MPYTLINYPDVINELPKQAKKIWIAAFNVAYEKYYSKNEQRAFKVAWVAVEKAGWKKDKSGKWVRWK